MAELIEYVVGQPGKDPAPLVPAADVPTRVDRLVAVIQGRIPSGELQSDLAAIMDAVAIMESAYASSRSGGWVAVTDVTQRGMAATNGTEGLTTEDTEAHGGMRQHVKLSRDS